MVNIFLPVLSYGYWALEFGVGWGYGGNGMPITATAVHQAFNPSRSLPYPNDLKYTEDRIFVYNSISAPGIVYSMNLETMELDIETYFKDLFLMITMFPLKTVSAAAAWGAGNTGTIAGNFTANTYKDSIMYQFHGDNPGDNLQDIDRTFLGGEITKYKISYETGKLLMENLTIKFMNFVDQTRAFTSDSDFDDGAYADWDDGAPFHATNCSVEWGGTAILGIAIEKASLESVLKKEQKHVAKDRVAGINWDGLRETVCVVEGYLTEKTQLLQIEKLHANKTKQTLEFIYNDAGGTEERKWQFTFGYISDHQIEVGIPSEGNPVKVKITISQGVGSAFTYAGIFMDHVDPYTSPKRIQTADR